MPSSDDYKEEDEWLLYHVEDGEDSVTAVLLCHSCDNLDRNGCKYRNTIPKCFLHLESDIVEQ